MDRTSAVEPVVPPLWSHDAILDMPAPGRPASAFVRRQLIRGGLVGVTDVAGVVAARLADRTRWATSSPLRVVLSRTGDLVLVQVDDARGTAGLAELVRASPDDTVGVGIVDLLTREWGRTVANGTHTGWWATLDARRGGARSPPPVHRV